MHSSAFLTSGTKRILEGTRGKYWLCFKDFSGQSVACRECSPSAEFWGSSIEAGGQGMPALGSVSHSHLRFFVSLKEKQDKPLMTPSHPSNGLKGLRSVDPTKLSSPKEPEWILSSSHQEFKASQLRNLNSVVFSLHH